MCIEQAFPTTLDPLPQPLATTNLFSCLYGLVYSGYFTQMESHSGVWLLSLS